MKQYLRRKASAKQKNSVRHSLATYRLAYVSPLKRAQQTFKEAFRTTAFHAIPEISSSRETSVNSKVRKTTEITSATGESKTRTRLAAKPFKKSPHAGKSSATKSAKNAEAETLQS